MGSFELSIKATGAEAWCLLSQLGPRKRRLRDLRIAFVKAVIDKLTVIKGDLTTMILTDTQEVDLSIQPEDKKGKPAQVDGTPAWVSSDPTIVEVIPAADGLSAVAKAGANLGHAQISVSADADLGAGVITITGVMEFDIVAGQAVSLGVVAGAPREQV